MATKATKEEEAQVPEVEIEVTALSDLKATEAGDGKAHKASETFSVKETKAYELREAGKVRFAGMSPANSPAAKAFEARQAKNREAAEDATRYGNKQGQSPPSNDGTPNANAPREAFMSTDQLRKEGPAHKESTSDQDPSEQVKKAP